MKTLGTPINGPRVRLRRLRVRDSEPISQLINDSDLVRWTTRIPHPYPEDGALQFIGNARRDWRNGSAYILGIEEERNGEFMGIISLSSVSLKHECAELGFWLGKLYWGQGFMTEAAQHLLEQAFRDLGLHRVYASAFADNRASRRVLEKCGFQLEGTLREAVVRHGKRQDYLNFGLLRREFTGPQCCQTS